MRRLLKTALLLGILATLSAGCGTTQIIASDPQAFITVDGVPVGRGVASVQKTGLPGTVQVSAKTEDGRRAFQSMSRSFGWPAGVFGFFTYGVLLRVLAIPRHDLSGLTVATAIGGTRRLERARRTDAEHGSVAHATTWLAAGHQTRTPRACAALPSVGMSAVQALWVRALLDELVGR